MLKEIVNTLRFQTALKRLLYVLLLLTLLFVMASPGFAYAKEETKKEDPIREVHNVGVDNEVYCFFVTHNVVLTASEVAEMSDEELTAAIIERSGLYMKKANCRKANHKEISVKSWEKKNRGFLLSQADIDGIRAAEPVDGEPVKFYMDLLIVTDKAAYEKSKENKEQEESEEAEEPEDAENAEDTEASEDVEESVDVEDSEGAEDAGDVDDEEEVVPVYSTYKRTSPRLLFAVVATEEDAKYGEDICIEDQKPEKQKQKKTKSRMEEPDDSAEEMLPEYRTISMEDRSGEPIKETLEDGSPVNLEWVEPKDMNKEEKSSIFDRIPGGLTGIAVMTVAAAAVIAGIAVAAKRRRESR